MSFDVWKEIYWGYYKINRNGTIVRLKPGRSTRPGFVLKPYHPRSDAPFVKLSCGSRGIFQRRVDQLVRRAFK